MIINEKCYRCNKRVKSQYDIRFIGIDSSVHLVCKECYHTLIENKGDTNLLIKKRVSDIIRSTCV